MCFVTRPPQASFTNKKGKQVACELADLLVVVDDRTTGRRGARRAVLIQAKMTQAGSGKTLSTAGDLTQLELMEKWPMFSLQGGFSPGLRDFRTCTFAGMPVDCGRYGLIDPQPSPKWTQHVPARSMHPGGNCLGAFLARMVESGSRGYGREASGTADDWSRTVSELLTVTGSLAFSYAAGFYGKRPRGSVELAFTKPLCLDSLWFVPPATLPTGGKPERPDYREEGEAQGISLIHIGVEREEGLEQGT